MTGELYIYRRKSKYIISKNIGRKAHTFGFFKSLDEAVFTRDLLVENDWDLNRIRKLGNIWKFNSQFVVVSILNDQIRFLEKFATFEKAHENCERIITDFESNPHGSLYGTYIYKSNNSFYIRKMINKFEVLFGIYKNLEDATFARDLLRDNNWDLDMIKERNPVMYSEIHEKYVVFGVLDNKLVVADIFDSEDEAIKNAEKSLEEYPKRKYKTGEKNVVFNGKFFAVHGNESGKITYYGSFRQREDAVAVKNLLADVDWDISLIDERRIYQFSDYFYRFHIFEGTVKIIGKYASHDDAVKDSNNLSDITFDELYDPENQYSKVNRYITRKSGKFWIKKNTEGGTVVLGPYDTRADAIEARDEYEENGWNINLDKESIYSSDNDYDGYLDEIISSMSMWQKIVYDTVVRLDETHFTWDELVNHSYLKRYKSGNFEAKVKKHLDELIDFGLITMIEDNVFRKEF